MHFLNFLTCTHTFLKSVVYLVQRRNFTIWFNFCCIQTSMCQVFNWWNFNATQFKKNARSTERTVVPESIRLTKKAHQSWLDMNDKEIEWEISEIKQRLSAKNARAQVSTVFDCDARRSSPLCWIWDFSPTLAINPWKLDIWSKIM